MDKLYVTFDGEHINASHRTTDHLVIDALNNIPDLENSTETENLVLLYKISYGFIFQGICVIGILCNILNLVVLTHKSLSQSPYVYLTGLAIADLISLVFFFLSGFSRGHFPLNYEWKIYEYYVYFPLGGMSTNVSALLTVVLTIERFIFVTFPIRARIICTAQHAKIVTLGVYIFAFCFDFPRFFAYKITENMMLGYTDFGHSDFFKSINWIRLIVLLLGSCFVVLVLNILLIRYICKSNRKRRKSLQSESNTKRIRDNNRLTIMLIAIICIFVIGEIPSSLVSRAIIVPLLGEATLKLYSYKIALVIATALVILEHSLNFFAYFICNRKFRCILKFYCLKCSGMKVPEILNDTTVAGLRKDHLISMEQLQTPRALYSKCNSSDRIINMKQWQTPKGSYNKCNSSNEELERL